MFPVSSPPAPQPCPDKRRRAHDRARPHRRVARPPPERAARLPVVAVIARVVASPVAVIIIVLGTSLAAGACVEGRKKEAAKLNIFELVLMMPTMRFLTCLHCLVEGCFVLGQSVQGPQ